MGGLSADSHFGWEMGLVADLVGLVENVVGGVRGVRGGTWDGVWTGKAV